MESIISSRKAGLNIIASMAMLFLAMVAGAAAYQPVYSFWLASPILNSVILGVFAAGAIYALYWLFHLQREFTALEQVQRRCGASDNVRWLQDDFIALLPQSLVRERLLLYFEQVDRGAPPNGDNHSERISLTLNMHTSLTRYIASVLVFMGLIGTFIGLLQAISAIGNILTTLPSGGLNTESASFFSILKQGLSQPLRGMATAFSTSLFGMVASLLIGFLHVQLASAQSRYISRLETLDAAVFRPSFSSRGAITNNRQESEDTAFASMHFAGAQRQLKENLDRLMAIVEKTQAMQANFREVMVTIGREIEITNGAINRLAANQDLVRNALSTLIDQTRMDTENQHLILAELKSISEQSARLASAQIEVLAGNREFHESLARLVQNEIGALAKMRRE